MKHKHGGDQHHGNPQHHTGDSEEHPLHVKLIPRENESAPESDADGSDGKPEKKPTKWFGIPDWWIAGGTIVLAAFAIASTILLLLQLNETHDTFVADQRPYVWIVQEQIPQVKLGEKVAWNFNYTNFGKTAAEGVAIRCQIRLQAHQTPELKDMFAPIHIRGHEDVGGVLMPNDRNNYWSTCFSDELINGDDLKGMNTFDAGAKLTIFFEYYDTAWHKYTSRVCMITRRPGQGSPTMPCPAESRID